jgi:ethanolamine kinase
VQFIDYEYSAHNPFAFDIGNHFCEYAGPECNYANYPTVDEASHFVRHYLNAGSDIPAVSAIVPPRFTFMDCKSVSMRPLFHCASFV